MPCMVQKCYTGLPPAVYRYHFYSDTSKQLSEARLMPTFLLICSHICVNLSFLLRILRFPNNCNQVNTVDNSHYLPCRQATDITKLLAYARR